jgi:hypothetical protein
MIGSTNVSESRGVRVSGASSVDADGERSGGRREGIEDGGGRRRWDDLESVEVVDMLRVREAVDGVIDGGFEAMLDPGVGALPDGPDGAAFFVSKLGPDAFVSSFDLALVPGFTRVECSLAAEALGVVGVLVVTVDFAVLATDAIEGALLRTEVTEVIVPPEVVLTRVTGGSSLSVPLTPFGNLGTGGTADAVAALFIAAARLRTDEVVAVDTLRTRFDGASDWVEVGFTAAGLDAALVTEVRVERTEAIEGALDGPAFASVALSAVDIVVAVDLVDRVVRTEFTDGPGDVAREPDVDGPAFGVTFPAVARVRSGLGGPLIGGLWAVLELGDGLTALFSAPFAAFVAFVLALAEPTGTVVPFLAAVGLLACGPDSGEFVVAVGRCEADLELATDEVEAELLSRSLRRPLASVVGVVVASRAAEDRATVGGRGDGMGESRRLLVSPREITWEVGRGMLVLLITADVCFPTDFGGLRDNDTRSSTGISISATLSLPPPVRLHHSPSEISLSDQFSNPWNPPASRICIHLLLICARTPSLATSISCLPLDLAGSAVCSVSGSTLRRIDETRACS